MNASVDTHSRLDVQHRPVPPGLRSFRFYPCRLGPVLETGELILIYTDLLMHVPR